MAKKNKVHGFFGDGNQFKPQYKEWVGMPEYYHEDKEPFQSVIVHFDNIEDRKAFAVLIKQTITNKTKSLWFPKAVITTYMDKQYISKKSKND